MAHLVLTEEQVRTVAESRDHLEVHDPNGRLLAILQPLDAMDLVVLSRNRQRGDSQEKLVPSSQVQLFLKRLEELDRSGAATQENTEELLGRMERGEAV